MYTGRDHCWPVPAITGTFATSDVRVEADGLVMLAVED
jgi:hypothetical protein